MILAIQASLLTMYDWQHRYHHPRDYHRSPAGLSVARCVRYRHTTDAAVVKMSIIRISVDFINEIHRPIFDISLMLPLDIKFYLTLCI